MVEGGLSHGFRGLKAQSSMCCHFSGLADDLKHAATASHYGVHESFSVGGRVSSVSPMDLWKLIAYSTRSAPAVHCCPEAASVCSVHSNCVHS